MTATPAYDTSEAARSRRLRARGTGAKQVATPGVATGDLLGDDSPEDPVRLHRKMSEGAKSLFSVQERGAAPTDSNTAEVVDLTARSAHARAELLPGSDPRRERPTRVSVADDPELLETMATVTEAIEYVERARGQLYTMYHLLSRAEILFAEASASFEEQGRGDEADLLDQRVIGRDMLMDRCGFEVVEEFDEEYYGPVSSAVRDLETRTVAGRRHARDAALRLNELEAGTGPRTD